MKCVLSNGREAIGATKTLSTLHGFGFVFLYHDVLFVINANKIRLVISEYQTVCQQIRKKKYPGLSGYLSLVWFLFLAGYFTST